MTDTAKTTGPDEGLDTCILCERIVPAADITRCESGEPICDDCWPGAVRGQAEDDQREREDARVH